MLSVMNSFWVLMLGNEIEEIWDSWGEFVLWICSLGIVFINVDLKLLCIVWSWVDLVVVCLRVCLRDKDIFMVSGMDLVFGWCVSCWNLLSKRGGILRLCLMVKVLILIGLWNLWVMIVIVLSVSFWKLIFCLLVYWVILEWMGILWLW